jgi:peptidoglycan/LPS O-acetylase OafA/YrhL
MSERDRQFCCEGQNGGRLSYHRPIPILTKMADSTAPLADAPSLIPYRPDIDGIRGVAVIAVILFHFFPSYCPGGFIGVDIFFVISGFLITGIILAGLSDSKFSFSGFYARRIRRIFPALLLTLAFCLIAGWYLLTPEEWRVMTKNVLGGAGFVSNLLRPPYTGYSPKIQEPLLHLWSLGIEEQFYIFWPLTLFGLWSINRFRKGEKLLAAILLLGVASFAFNISLRNGDPTRVFFNPLSRMWELLAGAALARYTQIYGMVKSRVAAECLSALGALLIAGGLALINETKPFPGWWAMLPVVGTVLLIAAGSRAWFNRTLLGARPLVAIGLISYPLYLWHWPMLVFLRLATSSDLQRDTRSNTEALVALLMLVFGVSWLTYRFWETPMRRSDRLTSRFRLGFLTASMAGIAMLGALGMRAIEPRLDSEVSKEIDRARADFSARWNFYEIRSLSTRATLLAGDSHMLQYEPRAEEAIRLNPHLATAVFATMGACPPLPGMNPARPEFQCPKFYDSWTSLAHEPRFSTVAISAYWEIYMPGVSAPRTYRGHKAETRDYEEAWDGLAEQLRSLSRAGKRVVIISSSPDSPELDPRFGFSRLHPAVSFRPAFLSRAGFEAHLGPVLAKLTGLARFSGAEIISPLDYLCPRGECPALDEDGLPIYQDKDHLRASKAKTLATFVDDLLRPER